MSVALLFMPALATAAAGEPSPCEVARAAAQSFLAEHAFAGQVSCRAHERAETGAVIRALPLQTLRSGPVVWPVQVLTASGRSYVQQVALNVTVRIEGWTASRKLTGGTQLQAEDLRRESRDWPVGTALPGNGSEFSQMPRGRVLRDMRAGEWVDARAMSAADAVQRADRVTVVVTGSALEIRFPATVLAPSRVGQTVRVQPIGRNDVLEGRLIDSTTVMVEGE